MPETVSRQDYLILEKDYKNAERRIDELEDRIIDSAKVIDLWQQKHDRLQEQHDRLQDKNKNLEGIINSNEDEQKLRFEKLKTIAINGIEAASLIIKAITESNTSHWQKKENLRNALGVLAILQKRIAKADPSPLPFDDDF